jgi:leucyl-tRNA synthetase
VESQVTLAVQVNGKLRGQLSVPASLDESRVVALAKADPKVARFIADGRHVKTIFVPGRLLNLVISNAK